MYNQLIWTLVLGAYVLAISLLTFFPYRWMIAQGLEPIRAVYYNRKIVHMLGSGVATLFVPLVFTDYWYPMVGGILLGGFIHLAHATGYRMYWFQTPQNRNDVSFALMWWASLSFLWWLFDDPWLAVLPALLMSFGDGVTGVVRNAVVKRRSKHLLGNVFMLAVSLPIGWYVGSAADPSVPYWGLAAAVVATAVEPFEFGPIDDNVLITVCSTAVLVLGTSLA